MFFRSSVALSRPLVLNEKFLRSSRQVQEVSPPVPVRLPMVDLGHLAQGCSSREIVRLARAAAMRPFDLAGGHLGVDACCAGIRVGMPSC